LHDAEDLVQDTMLRAWRAFDFDDEHRASLRLWLHRMIPWCSPCGDGHLSPGFRPA
jgi:hypothetical protein